MSSGVSALCSKFTAPIKKHLCPPFKWEWGAIRIVENLYCYIVWSFVSKAVWVGVCAFDAHKVCQYKINSLVDSQLVTNEGLVSGVFTKLLCSVLKMTSSWSWQMHSCHHLFSLARCWFEAVCVLKGPSPEKWLSRCKWTQSCLVRNSIIMPFPFHVWISL